MLDEREALRNTPRTRRGFTLMETLVAVAILVILMAVGFVAVHRYQRSMKQVELDGTAREIFVAAQNHLSVAQSQGLLQKRLADASGDTNVVGVPHARSEAGEDTLFNCFFVPMNDSRLTTPSQTVIYDMLPAFSLDDTVRTGGSYVIEYDPATATVTNVFYSDQSNLSQHVFSDGDYNALFATDGYVGAENAGKRLDGFGSNSAVIGWYGGDDLQGAARAKLVAPKVEVFNEECLWARVSFSTSAISRILSYKDANAHVQIILHGEKSGNDQLVYDKTLSDFSVTGKLNVQGSSAFRYETFVLDDVTAKGKHFANLWCTSKNALIPGEDVTVRAQVYSNNMLANIAQSASGRTNSLFADIATRSTAQGGGGILEPVISKVALVSNMRHLENLDGRISGYDLTALESDGATQAEQISNMRWAGDGSAASLAFLDRVHGMEARQRAYAANPTPDLSAGNANAVRVYDLAGTATEAGTFAPVTPTSNGASYTLSYNGGTHSISALRVNTAGKAGLFATLPASASVRDLELIDPQVTSTNGEAGALVAEALQKVSLTNVLVHDGDDTAASLVAGTSAVGGLAGTLGQGSVVDGCAASVYVRAGGLNSIGGGLAGTAESGTALRDSYAGGHTTNGTYDNDRSNVTATGTAGGLVGVAQATDISHCYATTSVSAPLVAGGLAGSTRGGSADGCYATGTVHGAAPLAGALVGTASGTTLTNNLYLSSMNARLDAVGSNASATGVSAIDESADTFDQFFSEGGTADAVPYDSVLQSRYGGKYTFKTVEQIGASTKAESAFVKRHFGDWPMVETLVVNTRGGANTAMLFSPARAQVGTHATMASSTLHMADTEVATSDAPSTTEPVAEPEAGEPAKADKRTITATIKTAGNKTVTVEATFDDAANIPDTATLDVREVNQIPDDYSEHEDDVYKDRPTKTETFMDKDEMARHLVSLSDGLKLTDDDYAFYQRLLDVQIIDGGNVVTPAAPLELSVLTDEVTPAASDALMAATFGAWDAKAERYAVEQVPTRNDSKKEGTKLVLATNKLGRLGIAGVARSLVRGTMGDAEVTLFAPPTAQVGTYSVWAQTDDAAREVLGSFGVSVARLAEHEDWGDVPAWLGVRMAEQAQDQSQPTVTRIYRVVDGVLGDVVAGAEGTVAPLAVADGDQFAVVRERTAALTEQLVQPQVVSTLSVREEVLSVQAEGETGEGSEQTYTVTWVNDDGTVLETDTEVAEGTTPTYDGAEPTKAADAQYTYTFNGWTPELAKVTADVTYTATYTETLNKYTVTWKNYNDSVLDTEEVEYGTVPSYKKGIPAKPSDSGNNYTFSYWDPNPVEVTGDVTYKAVYTSAPFEICLRDYTTGNVYIEGAEFKLTNNANVVVWRGKTASSGVVWVPKVSSEQSVSGDTFPDGSSVLGGATFEAGSTYKLEQERTDSSHHCSEGSYTLTVTGSEDSPFTLQRVITAGDLTTPMPSARYGIRFYLYNRHKATITYDYNYPAGIEGQPESTTKELSFLAYNGEYTVDKTDPDQNAAPIKAGYEFAGWSADDSLETYRYNDKVYLNTVNTPVHTMKACWRIPLQVLAKTYEGGNPSSAQPVSDSNGTYQVNPERSLEFASLQSFCTGYGSQKPAVADLNNNGGVSFAYATITPAGGAERTIGSIRYDASTRSWQYRLSTGGTLWTDIQKGDVLTLYYVSNEVQVRWVEEAEDGTFTDLRTQKKTITVGSTWSSTDNLLTADDKPVVEGFCYYRYLGFGEEEATSKAGLAKSDLASFQLCNSNNGFKFRTGTSGDGEAVAGDTIYVVYSKTPPEGSAKLSIENYTTWDYVVSSLKVASTDFLPKSQVILVDGEGHLSVFGTGQSIASQTTANLVVLGGDTSTFAVNGGLKNIGYDGGPVSVAVTSSNQVVRTTVTNTQAERKLEHTESITTGKLEGDTYTVVVSLDNAFKDVVLVKEWSADAYPDNYQVDLSLYEGDKPCKIDNASTYTLRKSEGWTKTIKSVPTRKTYSVTEKAIHNGSSSVTDDFTPAYTANDDNTLLTVTNTRSNVVCRVGDAQFKTIRAAVEHITAHNLTGDAATIYMLRDYIMAESGSVEIPAGRHITLTRDPSLQAATVTRGFNGAADMFCVKGDLTITDLTITGLLNNTRFYKDGNGGLVNVDGGTFTAGPGSTFTNSRATNGSAIYAQNSGKIVLDGTTITKNRAISGGAVGVADASSTITVRGDTVVYDNGNEYGGGQYNIYMNQDSNSVILVTVDGLGSNAKVGVHVPNGTSNALYNAHGKPAQPFATFENGGNKNLNKFVSDRLGTGPAGQGAASDVLANTVVWGETFSFDVDVQWLDEHLNKTSVPDGAQVTLQLTGGSITAGQQTTIFRDTGTGWTHTFKGLAKYDSNGNPYEYKLNETSIQPEDYRRIVFTGDVGVDDNPLTFDAMSDNQKIMVSNYYRYTTFTVKKVVKPATQGLNATFAVYRVPKSGAELDHGNVRYFGVGGVEDLPLALRGGVYDALHAQANTFYTDGANQWFLWLPGTSGDAGRIVFHRFYDSKFGQFTGDGGSFQLVDSASWKTGDVVLDRLHSNTCWVYGNDNQWHQIATNVSVSYLSFSRQDGDAGVESVGGEAAGKSCTLNCPGVESGSNEASYTFTTAEKLSSDYYYYAVETSVAETNGKGRGIGGTHRLVAAYDPSYSYDQRSSTLTVTNTYRDYLSVDKMWPADTTNFGTCTFDLYEITDGETQGYLSDATKFAALVKGSATESVVSGWKWVAEFTLPETKPEAKGSWVHVLEEESAKMDPNKVYFVRERESGSVKILNPDVTQTMKADAVYSYYMPVNQITVYNTSDILCKIDDVNGSGEHPFRTLNDALEYGRTRTDGESNTEFTIQMLRDYTIPASDIMQLRAGEKITLTTAPTEGCEYTYKSGSAAGKRKATITRKDDNKAPFVIMDGTAGSPQNTSFTLQDIELDGSGVALNHKVGNTSYNGGSFVNARNATIVLERKDAADSATGVVLKNALATNGGAVYAEKSTVSMTGVTATNCRSSASGNHATWTNGGGVVFVNGGSVTVTDSAFDACTSACQGSVLYDASDTGTLMQVSNCTFANCEAAFSGTVASRGKELVVKNSTFTDCKAGYRGGGIWHGNDKAGSHMLVEGCTFTRCTTASGDDGQGNSRHGGGGVNAWSDTFEMSACNFDHCEAYVRGGGVLHFNLQAATSLIDGCTFESCTTVRSNGGGGGAGLTGLKQTIKNCKFNKCVSASSAGGGIDVGHFNVDKDVTVDNCTFTECEAGGANGGGICVGGKTLTVKRSTFDGCKSLKNHGGAIAMSAGGNMDAIVVQGCTIRNCSASNSNCSGGAIYGECRAIDLGDYEQDGANPIHTTIANCVARNNGGGVYQARNVADSFTRAVNCTFDACTTVSADGGAIRTTATEGIFTNSTFKNCSSQGKGGSIFQSYNAGYEDTCKTYVSGCTFQNSRAGTETSGDAGGAIYTEVLRLTIGNGTTFKACKARSTGGAVYQNRSNAQDAFATIEDVTFDDCATWNGSGGGLYTNVPAVTLRKVAFKDCTAKNSGGAVSNESNGTYLDKARVLVEDCSFKSVTAQTQYGGAIKTNARDLTVLGNTRLTTFEGCTAYYQGGAICHDRNSANSTTTITNCSFSTCESQVSEGGSVHSRATTMDLTDCSFKNSKARSSAGAVLHWPNNGDSNVQIPTSYTNIVRCTFNNCECTSGTAGAISSGTLKLMVQGKAGTPTFQNCTSWGQGGAVRHERNWDSSTVALADVSFVKCESRNSEGGSLWTNATQADFTGCSFKNSTAHNGGGAVLHWLSSNSQVSTSHLFVRNTTFDTCTGATGNGGALNTNVLALKIEGAAGTTTFQNCTSWNNGGAVRHDRNWATAYDQLTACSFVKCESQNNEGGALWTNVTQVDLTDTSFAQSKAKSHGGAVMHVINNNDGSAQIETSRLTVAGCSFKVCESRSSTGGAVYTNALTASFEGKGGTTPTFQNCTSWNEGGAIRHDQNRSGSSMTVRACMFDVCTSRNSQGGALLERGRTLNVANTTFQDCTSSDIGGAVMHNPSTNTGGTGTSTFNNCRILRSTSRNKSGGGLYANRVAVTMANTTIADCSAKENGGGIFQGYDEARPLVLDACTISGNTSGNFGGGVYFDPLSTITLKNNASVIGNKLGNTTVENGAGLYISRDNDAAVLVLGCEENENETITVYDNTTSAGEQSNARIGRTNTWQLGRRLNREISVRLYSNLVKSSVGSAGSIGVCDPGPENSKFGLESASGRKGMEYIVSDIDSLRGILDPSDTRELRVIWYAPPVCKITDAGGKPFRYKDGDEYKPAVFSSLTAAFTVVNNLKADALLTNDGNPVKDVQIQMLVSGYRQNENLPELKRSIVLTTAEPGPDEYDYPLSATSERCTITRGTGAAGSLIKLASGVELDMTKVVLDGGSTAGYPLTANANGGLIYGKTDARVVLGENSVLQNSAAGDGYNGGAVYITGGTDPTKPSLLMEMNATIRNCSARDGGGVYLTAGALMQLEDAPHIEECAATHGGGAVYVSPYATLEVAKTLENGSKVSNPQFVIRNNRITDPSGNGAGVYLANNDSKFYLKMGASARLQDNYIEGTDDSTRLNGSEAYPQIRQDVYIGEGSDVAESLVITGDLVAQPGSVWVWAERPNHYEGDMQFAVIDDGVTLTDTMLGIFRNARDDEATQNDTGEYYTGMRGDNPAFLYWGNYAGVDVAFVKVDGFGKNLEGAEFALYKDYEGTSQANLVVDGAKQQTVTSGADGSVRFMVPQGVYYMRETAAPDGCAVNEAVYRVVVGKRGASRSGISLPTGTDFLIQRMRDAATADAVPNIATYGLLNQSATKRKVILKKVGASGVESTDYVDLEGAVFDLLAYDQSVVMTGLTSRGTGTLLVDDLPVGTYYLHETSVPGGYEAGSDGRWFTLTVTQDEVVVSVGRNTASEAVSG